MVYFSELRYSLLREIKEQILERICELLLRIHNWCLNYSLVCLLWVNLYWVWFSLAFTSLLLVLSRLVLDCVGLYKVGWLFVWFGFRIILIRGSLHRYNWLSFYLSILLFYPSYFHQVWFFSIQFIHIRICPNTISCVVFFVSRCC